MALVDDYYVDGFMSLAPDGKVISVDAHAQRIIDADIGIRLIDGRLWSTARSAQSGNEELQKFLYGPQSDQTPFVNRSDKGTLLMLHRHASSEADGSAGAILRVAIVDLDADVDPQTVRSVFGLTPAEQSVVGALTESSNATVASRRLGLSRETVKSHLRSIYGKTNTQSLTELMLLIGKLVNR